MLRSSRKDTRRKDTQSEAPGLSLLADLDLRQLFSTLPVTPVPRAEGRSDGGEIALRAVRRVASLNSETRAAVP
jgi:hypothetical protein